MPVIYDDKRVSQHFLFHCCFSGPSVRHLEIFNSLQKQAGQHRGCRWDCARTDVMSITFYCFNSFSLSRQWIKKKKQNRNITSQGIMSFSCPKVLKSWKLPVAVSVTSSLFCGLQESLQNMAPACLLNLTISHHMDLPFRTNVPHYGSMKSFEQKFPYAWKSILSFLSWLNFSLSKNSSYMEAI